MALEVWIVLALVAAAAIGAAVVRLRRKRARIAAADIGGESNVYPLW